MTAPSRIEFDRKRLTARVGGITFVLINGKRRGHNIRIHRGDVGGLPLEAFEDLGGTQGSAPGTRAVVELAGGRVQVPVLGRCALAHPARRLVVR